MLQGVIDVSADRLLDQPFENDVSAMAEIQAVVETMRKRCDRVTTSVSLAFHIPTLPWNVEGPVPPSLHLLLDFRVTALRAQQQLLRITFGQEARLWPQKVVS